MKALNSLFVACAMVVSISGCAAVEETESGEQIAEVSQASSSYYSCVVDDVCYEQSGSYPSVCGSKTDPATYYPHQGCSTTCDVNNSDGSLCEGGCYTHYSSSKSWGAFASAYTCKIVAPSASDVHVTWDDNHMIGNATVSNGYSSVNDTSTFDFYAATSISGASAAIFDTHMGTAQNYASISGLPAAYKYFKFCVTPEVTGFANSGSSTSTVAGDQVCTSWGLQDDVPSVSNVKLTISGNTAVGSYTYSDAGGAPESGSDYAIHLSSDSTGSSYSKISTDSSVTLDASYASSYMRYCVRPSNGFERGTSYQCTGWKPVGYLLELYKDSDASGTNINIAYKWSAAGTCFNLSNYSFNEMLTSYQIAGATSVTWYKDSNCSGTSATVPASSNATADFTDSSWNDVISSVKVTY